MIKLYLSFTILLLISGTTIGQTVRDTSIHQSPISIYFDSDQADIQPTDIAALKKYVSNTSSLKSYHIVVEGHADLQGDDDYNMRLSEKRCRSTIDSLIAWGIPDSLIEERYFGERQPVAKGHDAQALKQNRRVDITLQYIQKLVYLKGELTDEKGVEVPNAIVHIRAQDYHYKTTTDTTGLFDIIAPAWKDITITAEAKDHFIRPRTIRSVDLLKSPTLKLIVPKIEQGKVFVLNQLLFHGNMAVILPTSRDELQALRQTMVINSDVCIEIAGHINLPSEGKVSKNSWHYDLSIARALTIRDTLLHHGVHPGRLVAKGYGNWQMKFPNARSYEHQQQNRRVEVIIKDCIWTKTTASDSLTIEERSPYVGEMSFRWTDKKFNPDNLSSDLRVLKKEDAKLVLDHLKLLKEKGLSPNGYTYQELMDGVIKE